MFSSCTFNPEHSPKDTRIQNKYGIFGQGICLEHDLIDIWRVRHPKEKRFTWRQKSPITERRLDFWLISDSLQDDGADQDALKWFKSYLTNRLQRCNVNNHLSSATPLNCGVPQGSTIGPLLFFIYINDLPNSLSLGPSRMYADDTNVTFVVSDMLGLEKCRYQNNF